MFMERKEGLRRPRKSDVIIGVSPWIRALYDRMAMVASTDVTVAISGESGTGKELIARTLHALSGRIDGPFVVVNCAAIPENLLEDELFGHVRGAFSGAVGDRPGLFAAADGGTLFFDEIGEMSLGLQAKLLRVLQTREFRRVGDDEDTRVDIRVITATNVDLEKAVEDGRFRTDLYYRIHVFPMHMLPLRERREDIPLLAQHFLLLHRQKTRSSVEGFSPEALQSLMHHGYPGNIRELENRVQRALVMATGKRISVADLATESGPYSQPMAMDLSHPFRQLKRQVVEEFEREYTVAILEANGGNIAAAARQAGMDRKNLWSLAKKYNIAIDEIREVFNTDVK